MTMSSEAMPSPPCALLVMCNECGRGVEILLPIDHESFARSLARHVWLVVILTPPGQTPILYGALCGDCAPKVFSPEILRTAEERRQKLLQETP
jgi:hypothetical protein